MSKDPAILFYTSDFLAGTFTMSDDHVGKYIKLLCLQHQKGRLTEQDMLYICNTYVEDVYNKFKKDQNGLYYNIRMEAEATKRKDYSESRKYSRSFGKQRTSDVRESYVGRMENENISDNSKTAHIFIFDSIWDMYPRKLGKKEAERHFNASVKTEQDYKNIQIAVQNYVEYCKDKEEKYIQHGKTWFNNWKDWINYKVSNKPQLMELG